MMPNFRDHRHAKKRKELILTSIFRPLNHVPPLLLSIELIACSPLTFH